MSIHRAIWPLMMICICLYAGMTVSNADGSYTVDSREVHITLNTDGGADVVERIGFSIIGGLTNMPFQIESSETSPVEIREIRFMREGEWVVCNLLSAGQWDNQVFSGSYSQTQLTDRLDIKVYGYFNAQRSDFVLSYHVPEFVVQNQSNALFQRMIIFPNDATTNRNIRVHVQLPGTTYRNEVMQRVNGVIISEASQVQQDSLLYMVPDTVPGESVQVVAWLPLRLFDPTVLVHADDTVWQDDQPAIDVLLKARELAAEKVGIEAHARIIARRLSKTVASAANILTVSGFIIIAMFLLATARKKRHMALSSKWEKFLLQWRVYLLPIGLGFGILGVTLSVWFAFWDGYIMMIPALLMIYIALQQTKSGGQDKIYDRTVDDYCFDHR